jgi:hypothetical protein
VKPLKGLRVFTGIDNRSTSRSQPVTRSLLVVKVKRRNGTIGHAQSNGSKGKELFLEWQQDMK